MGLLARIPASNTEAARLSQKQGRQSEDESFQRNLPSAVDLPAFLLFYFLFLSPIFKTDTGQCLLSICKPRRLPARMRLSLILLWVIRIGIRQALTRSQGKKTRCQVLAGADGKQLLASIRPATFFSDGSIGVLFVGVARKIDGNFWCPWLFVSFSLLLYPIVLTNCICQLQLPIAIANCIWQLAEHFECVVFGEGPFASCSQTL